MNVDKQEKLYGTRMRPFATCAQNTFNAVLNRPGECQRQVYRGVAGCWLELVFTL